MNLYNERRGYTLIELMLVVAILGIISSIFPALFIQITRFFRSNQARTEIQRDARTSFDIIGRNLRQAKASTITVSNKPGQPPFSALSFTRIDDKQFYFYQDGSELMQVSPSTVTLAANLRYIAFGHPRSDDGKLMTVTVTLEKATYNQQTKALQLSVEKFRVQND